jgi:hypothetical protein
MEPLPGGFLRANAPWLAAGFLLTFASSFGQTFFIAVFVGEIRADFDRRSKRLHTARAPACRSPASPTSASFAAIGACPA